MRNFKCLVGLRQGERLSPILFLFLVNVITDHLKGDMECNEVLWDTLVLLALLYAGDVIIAARTDYSLQCCMNRLEG